MGFVEQRPLGGQRRAWQGGGFRKAQMNARNAFGVEHEQFLQYTRPCSAKGEAATAGRRPAVEPGLKEHRADAITDRDPAHALSHGGNFPGAVGKRDQRSL